jgi:hypothetical protein
MDAELNIYYKEIIAELKKLIIYTDVLEHHFMYGIKKLDKPYIDGGYFKILQQILYQCGVHNELLIREPIFWVTRHILSVNNFKNKNEREILRQFCFANLSTLKFNEQWCAEIAAAAKLPNYIFNKYCYPEMYESLKQKLISAGINTYKLQNNKIYIETQKTKDEFFAAVDKEFANFPDADKIRLLIVYYWAPAMRLVEE